jgi:hypothetical protein
VILHSKQVRINIKLHNKVMQTLTIHRMVQRSCNTCYKNGDLCMNYIQLSCALVLRLKVVLFYIRKNRKKKFTSTLKFSKHTLVRNYVSKT